MVQQEAAAPRCCSDLSSRKHPGLLSTPDMHREQAHPSWDGRPFRANGDSQVVRFEQLISAAQLLHTLQPMLQLVLSRRCACAALRITLCTSAIAVFAAAITPVYETWCTCEYEC